MLEFREISAQGGSASGGKNDAEYNPLFIAGNVPFTQGPIYGQWQEMTGRKVRRFEIKQGEGILGFFQVIKYPMPFSQNILYIPHGPVLKAISCLSDEFLKTFHDKLLEIAKEENSVFVRFDAFPKNEENLSKFFKRVPSHAYRSSYFQPKFEWILSLEKPEEEILDEMHPKTRYNINLARKRGIKIEIISENFDKYFHDFYGLIEETAKRDNFNLHPKDYYRNIFKTLDSSNAFLAVAEYEGKTLLVNLVMLYGKTAYFIFGGSSDEFKNLMFSHLAQWEAIKESKTRGMAIYNFGGVGPSTSLRVNNNDQFEGISRFKKRFAGELLKYSDSYDIVLKHTWYYLYNLRKWLLNLK